MIKILKISKFPLIIVFLLYIFGCETTYPKDFLKLSTDSLHSRQLESRQYETKDEAQIISACAGVLQDLGFTLDNSETELGLVVGSKERDATDVGQVTVATFSVLLSAMGGVSSDAFNYIDKVQKIRASIVTKPDADGNKIIVRVTFQRIVWNAQGNISRMEALKDANLYQGFFERLSKSIFLEAQQI